MRNKTIKLFNTVMLILLCASMMITTQSSYRLFAESKTPDIVNLTETNENSQETKQEPTDDKQTESEATQPTTRVANEPILSLNATPDSNQDNFNMIISVTLPANSQGNVVTVILPQWLLVPTPPSLDTTTLIGFKDEEYNNGRKLTITLADATSSGGTKSLNLIVSHKDFIRHSQINTYTISASFKNKNNQYVETSQNYTVNVDFNKQGSAEVTGSVNGFFIEDQTATWGLDVNTTFDLSNGGHAGKIVFNASTFQKMKVKAGSSITKNSDGNFEMPITKEMISTTDNRKLKISLPIEPDTDKTPSPLFTKYNFDITGSLVFDNTKSIAFTKQFENYYLQLEHAIFPNYNIFEMMQNNSRTFSLEVSIRYKNDKIYDIVGSLKTSEKDFLTRFFAKDKQNQIKFKAPHYFQINTGNTTDLDNNYYATIENIELGHTSSYRMSLKTTFDASIKYDITQFNGLENITESNYTFTDVYLKLHNDSQNHKVPIGELSESIRDLLNTDMRIFESVNHKVKQGHKNALIASFRPKVSDMKKLPKYEYSYNYDQAIDSTPEAKKYTDLFKVNRVVFNQEFIKQYYREQNLKFYYTTNQNTERYISLNDGASTLDLSSNEWITQYRITSEGYESEKAISVASQEDVISLYGDIMINENKKEVIIYSRYDLILTKESTTSQHYKKPGFYAVDINILPNIINNYDGYMYPSTGGNLYPGETKYFNLYMPNISSAENLTSITYRYRFSDQSLFKITGYNNVTPYFSGLSKVEMVYTTNRDSNQKKITLNRGQSINLPAGEYFDFFELTLPPNEYSDSRGNAHAYVQIESIIEKTPDSTTEFRNVEMLEIVSSEGGTITGKIPVRYVKMESHNIAKQSALLSYDGTSSFSESNGGKNLSLGIIEAGKSYNFNMKFDVQYNSAGLMSSSTRLDLVENPTFYIKIPDEFDYKGVEFKGSLQNKTPKIRIFENMIGERILKIEFYGNPDSDTGFKYGRLNDFMTLKLEAKRFISGGIYKDISVFSFVDNSESLKRLNNQEKRIKSELYITNDIHEREFANEYEETVKVPYNSRSEQLLDFSLQQSATVIVDASFQKQNSFESTKNIDIRHGESFDATLNIFNGANELMQNFVMYVPVPQGKGGDTDQWKVILQEAGVDVRGQVDVFVSRDNSATMNELETGKFDQAGMYTSLKANEDLSDVTMIKLKSTSIKQGDIITLKGKFSNADMPNQSVGSVGLKAQTTVKYAYNSFGQRNQNQIVLNASLTSTKIKGRLFIDENENGIMNSGEAGLAGETVQLKDSVTGDVKSTVVSDADGNYSFEVGGLTQNDVLSVTSTDRYRLTYQGKGNRPEQMSYFSQSDSLAHPTLENAEYLNAGFIDAPSISVNPAKYDVKMRTTAQIQYSLSENQSRKITFTVVDESIATVDENGMITPVSPGLTDVELSYLTASGLKISATVKIEVLTNDKPSIFLPDVVTMNVGDIWDPKNSDIIKGIGLTDDHDKDIDYNDLNVDDDSIPREGNFLFFFRTASTGRLTKPGTYQVKYYYTDKDGNYEERFMKVKVNGQPYIRINGSEPITDESKMPEFYYRMSAPLDPFQDAKAYYMKADDIVGIDPKETEIDKDDRETGIFTVSDPVDNEGNLVVGYPKEAGKYKGTYYIRTNSAAKSVAELSVGRTLYAQGEIDFSGDSITHPASSEKHSYESWDEFYQDKKDQLNIIASVVTPNQDGTTEPKDLTDTIRAINEDGSELNFKDLDFSLGENQTIREVKLKLRVTDEGKANWNQNGASVYGVEHKDIDLVITVQEFNGAPPTIHTTPIKRISTDEIRDNTVSPSIDLSTPEAMADAKKHGKQPLRDRLINDVEFRDPDGTVGTKEILFITRTSSNPDKPDQKKNYDPNNEDEIKDMMTSVGTYTVTYRATDDKGNRITAERTIYVAGPTVFTKSMDADVAVDKDISILQKNEDYIPGPVYAYHIDYDEVTKDYTTVVTDPSRVNQRALGTQEVIFRTEHHFRTYPDGTDRPKDELKQLIKVHGHIEFTKNDNETVELFVGQSATPLDEVTASYQKAPDSIGSPSPENVTVTLQSGDETISSSSATKKRVTLEADASTQTGIAEHKATLNRTYAFYGLPEITGVTDSIRIKEDVTQDELKKVINAKGQIDLPDGNKKTDLIVEYDFAHMNDALPYVTLKTDYTLTSGETREATKVVSLVKVAKPTLSANDVEYNVGDIVDLKKDSQVSGSFDGKGISIDDITFDTSIVPVDADNKANAPKTYKVTFSFEDKDTLSYAEKDILVKVNGLPKIHNTSDLVKRVGDDLSVWNTAYVSWERAPDIEGKAVTETFTHYDAGSKNASFELRNMTDVNSGSSVTFADAINNPGYYQGEYYAKTPTGGEASVQHTLLLHGQPKIESAGSITISKNVDKIDDFLSTYRDKLEIKATVKRAYMDRPTEVLNLTDQVTANQDDIHKIQFGTEGSYPVELSVTDSVDIPGSKHNTATKTVIVNIQEIVGTPPVIITPESVQRVAGDDIGFNNAGESNIEKYLLDKAKYEIKSNDNTINTKNIISIKGISGPGKNLGGKNPNNDQLKEVMNTVGEYQAVIHVEDIQNNIVEAVLKIEVAGPTEFGYIKNGTFVKLGDTLDIRQSDTKYSYSSIIARHMDPSGEYDTTPIDQTEKDDIDISQVSVQDAKVIAPHHYKYYDDDPSQKRKNDSHSYKLLVNGKIEFKNVEDIHTRVGTDFDPLETVQSATDIKKITAEYIKIDATGIQTTKVMTPTANKSNITAPGKYDVILSAADDIVGDTATQIRKVYVSTVPTVHYKDSFNLSSQADINALMKAADIHATYTDYEGNIQNISGNDIIAGYQDTMERIAAGGAGKSYPLDISVKYTDNNIDKSVSKTSNVYVLNEASAIVVIPKYLEMTEDKESPDDTIRAQADISLYRDKDGNSKDTQENNVPAIKISADTSVQLSNGSESFTALTYTADGRRYDDTSKPIMRLEYNQIEQGHFFLKTEKEKVSKGIGLYQGVLNIYMEYEGD